MKKLAVLALAALLVVAFTVPASALENTFGGYWRTRMFQQRNFDGDNNDSRENVMVDTRTRLYYTAKLNDNLKFVNKFEFDTNYGSAAGFGRVGTDAVAIEIKNSYADFNVGPVNFLVGAQGFTLARGFISDEDGIGIKAIFKVNDGLYLPFIWQKMYDGNDPGVGEDRTRGDIDMYIFTPVIYLSKDIKINPYYVFVHSQDGFAFSTVAPAYAATSFNNINAHVFGLDFDGKFGAASMWFTGIMQTGSSQATGAAASAGLAPGTEIDLAGYLLALGGKFDLGKADIHGQAFLATGDKAVNPLADKEAGAFLTTNSTYYYWAEILGRGIFDQQDPVGSTGFRVSNILAANLGAKFMPMDKLSITADLWWAKLDEENAFNEDELGIEADVVVSYKLVEGLTLDVVGAWLFAGDAVSADGKNDKDPYEFGTRLSLSF
ncbi:MAG: hypothetical protein EHM85_08690 [Desulfobacteraceae bacterium]|nr:MAG: hypothetical protein EHM85_08690 [Desulfobacteraceae bacterium]